MGKPCVLQAASDDARSRAGWLNRRPAISGKREGAVRTGRRQRDDQESLADSKRDKGGGRNASTFSIYKQLGRISGLRLRKSGRGEKKRATGGDISEYELCRQREARHVKRIADVRLSVQRERQKIRNIPFRIPK